MKISRRMVVWVAALAVTVGVSSASAGIISVGVLSENPDGSTGDGYTVPLSVVRSISTDGSQACGSSVYYNGARVPFRAWAPYGGPPNMIAMANKGGGHAAGIGVTGGGDIRMSGNVGSWNFGNNIGRYSTNGTSWCTIRDHKGKYSEALLGEYNSTSPDGRILVGQALKSYKNYGYYWDTTGVSGCGLGNATRVNGLYKKTKWESASNVNTMVGQDKHGRRNTKDGAIHCSNISTKSVQGIPALAGDFDDRGQGRGISANGQYCSGYLYAGTYGYTYVGFRWSPGDASSTACLPYGSDHLSWAGDVADDGTCVGWSYGTDPAGDGSYDAAFWPGGTLQPELLKPYLESVGVDTSEWSWLIRIWTISDDGNIVGGYGIWAADGSIRGFVADLRPPLFGDLDILPNDDPNLFTVNKQSKGRIPMELYGTEDLDVADIDLESINIAGVVEPLQAKVVDNGSTLLLNFSRRDLIDALGLDALADGTVLDVTVRAARVGDGYPIEASDSIEIVARQD
ncbi:MAG: hypothetical protein ACYTBZ_11030 [Planctomycetota bacterium]